MLCRRRVITLGAVSWWLDTAELAADSNQDRLRVVTDDQGCTALVADGAGGMAGGGEAADTVVASMVGRDPPKPEEIVAQLAKLDAGLAAAAGGESTAVLARLRFDGEVFGVSVGDTEAWARCHGTWSELTEH